MGIDRHDSHLPFRVALIILIVIAAVSLAAMFGMAGRARAHDRWSNGEELPTWLKVFCCTKADVHRLNSSAVHAMSDGYHIDGLKTIVPYDRVMRSEDEFYWAFWNPTAEPEPDIFCFLAPPNGS